MTNLRPSEEKLLGDDPDHRVLPMVLRAQFVSDPEATPLLRCPHCKFSGRGWQRFPKPSLCGKVSAALLAPICCCCLPFCCRCSINWEWLCPECHRAHSEDKAVDEILGATYASYN